MIPRFEPDDVGLSRPFRPSRVAVVGGDLGAHLAALALKEWKPELDVTFVAGPVRAGACALPPAFVPFLFGYLGVDALAFVRAVAPTMSLGVRHHNGERTFDVAFANGDLVDAQAHDGHTGRYSVAAQLMAAARVPVARVAGRVIPLLRETPFGLDVDVARASTFLRARARAVGITVVERELGEVELSEGGVKRAIVDGRALAFDLWVDADGAVFSRLDVPFERYGDSLLADAVVTATVTGGGNPFTELRTMDAGTAWVIPLRDRMVVAYVHASAHLTRDEAQAEIAAAFFGAHDFAAASFIAGRHSAMVAGNVVALGSAYATVDPYDAHGFHLVLAGIERLLALLHGGAQLAGGRSDALIGHQADALRWLGALMGRFNRARDTAYWREVHMADWSGLESTVRDFVTGRGVHAHELPYAAHELELLLLGQGVVPETLTPATSASEWNELQSMRAALIGCALPEAEAWPLLEDRAIWSGLLEGDWARPLIDSAQRNAPTRGRSQDAIATWTRELGVPSLLGRDAEKLADDFPTSPNIDFGKFLRRVPEVILRPRDQAQLGECLQLCARRRMPMRVRGAGHSSGGQTLADEGAIIDLRWLKRVIAESPSDDLVRVEAGLWWLELCGHLRASDRRPLVLTDNWRSTIGGTLAVGGFGDASHREGLQIAGVRELMVMTLDGMRHRVRPGDDLFDWSLAGRGQLGIITEVVLETTTRGYDLEARVLRWSNLAAFVADARVIIAEGRFDWLRARLSWLAGCPVGAAAGHLGEGVMRARDFDGLSASIGPSERLDLFAKSNEDPDERWDLASPGVEVILPANAAGLAAIDEIHRRLGPLTRYLPRGSSIMALRGMPLTAIDGMPIDRTPMAPLPAHDVVLMLAVRPEMPVAEVPAALPVLRSIADLALDAGGKVYLMGLEPTRPGWLARQLGTERLTHLRALKAKWDPDGLLNPGLLGA